MNVTEPLISNTKYIEDYAVYTKKQMIAHVRSFVLKKPLERSVFASSFEKYILSTTDYTNVPAKFFFCLPEVP